VELQEKGEETADKDGLQPESIFYSGNKIPGY
jgi:hypothetical protein